MNPRQARRERREAERKAKKLELKKVRLAEKHPTAIPAAEPRIEPTSECEPARPSPPVSNGFVSQKRIDSNRANAQLSTGPRTPNGKLASSRNSTKHGLASGQLLIRGEDPAAYEALLSDLLADHQPANSTEELLVNQMAQSFWLQQRSLRLQNICFTPDGVDEKNLALFLRYGAAHQRAFHKALNDLQRLQKERRKASLGFVSQQPLKTASAAGFVSQNHPSRTCPDLQNGFVSQTEPPRTDKTAQTACEAA